jgi:hypothetical protein
MQMLVGCGRAQEARALAARIVRIAAEPAFKSANERTRKMVEDARRLTA